jgi:hypothetical protein
MTEEDGI